MYASSGTLHAVIYGERLNLRNYWSGSWLSVWKIENATSGSPTLSGSVKVRESGVSPRGVWSINDNTG